MNSQTDFDKNLDEKIGELFQKYKNEIHELSSSKDHEATLSKINEFLGFINRYRNCSYSTYFDESIHKIITSINKKRFNTSHLLKEKNTFNIAFVFSRFNDSGGAAFTHRCILEKYESEEYKFNQFILVTNNSNENEYKHRERYQYMEKNIEFEDFFFLPPNDSLIEKGKQIENWLYEKQIDFLVMQPDLQALYALSSQPVPFAMTFSADWHVFTIGPGIGDKTLSMTSDQVYKYDFMNIEKDEVLNNIMLPLPPASFVDSQKALSRKEIGVPEDAILSGTTNLWKCTLGDNETLLTGIAHLMRENNNYHHIFIGTPRGLGNVDFFLARNPDIKDRFHFSGVIPHIFTILKQLDFYINSFPVSGASNTEAGLCGVPSIDLYTDRDMSGHGTELLRTFECEASNLKEFVKIGNRFIKDKNYRNELGEYIRNKMARELTKNNIIKNKIYDTFVDMFYEKVRNNRTLPSLEYKQTITYEKAISLYNTHIEKNLSKDEKNSFLYDLTSHFSQKPFGWYKRIKNCDILNELDNVLEKIPSIVSKDYRIQYALAGRYFAFGESKLAMECLTKASSLTKFDTRPLGVLSKLKANSLKSDFQFPDYYYNY